MTNRILIFVCAAALTAPVTAQDNGASFEQRLKVWLKRYPAADTNKDGVLTREEAQAYRDNVLAKSRKRGGQRERVVPTVDDVRYGEHERNVFDLWLPDDATKSKKPLPVYVFFHGGGFVGGDKSGFDPTPFLNAGMAVVSGNYRFVNGTTTLSPAPLLDASRAIQFLKWKAREWNLDPDRIAVSGSSAGAVIALWIGYHNDLADPASDDPVARQTTRVRCIAPINGPTNLDPRWITKNLGGPKHVHGSFPKMFGAQVTDVEQPEVLSRILESSPWEHVSADDPPTLLIYTGSLDGIPLPASASTGLLIHHAWFGKKLKERLDDTRVPNQFVPGYDPRKDQRRQILDWLDEHLIEAK